MVLIFEWLIHMYKPIKAGRLLVLSGLLFCGSHTHVTIINTTAAAAAAATSYCCRTVKFSMWVVDPLYVCGLVC